MADTHDLVVVGGGSGGLAAAHTATFRGASVALVVDGPVGGDCTWTGCVPSKALLAATGRGLRFDAAMSTVRDAVLEVAGGETPAELCSLGIDVIEGRGRLIGDGRVDVGGDVVAGRQIVVSPGSRPAMPPIDGLSDVGALTNDSLWVLEELPSELLVIGGGPIGCEMGLAFTRMGAGVTIVEGEARLLPRDDADAAAVAASVLRDAGADVVLGTTVSSVTRRHDRIVATLSDGTERSCSHVLVATGRAPNHSDMGLEDVGVEMTSRGWIAVDRHLATTAKGVWAVGDAVGSTQFTHAAAHMARLAVHNALRIGAAKVRKFRFDPAEIPWVTFLSPEIGQVGVTEAEAVSIKGARVAELSLDDVDRGVATRRTEGFVKLIAAPRPVLGSAAGGRLIGATIVAPNAGEMIGEAALAIRTKMFAGRLAQTVHPYPSWSFAMQRATAQFFGTFAGKTARPPRNPEPGSPG